MEYLFGINLYVCGPGDLFSSLPSVPVGKIKRLLEIGFFMTSCLYRQIRDSRLFATKLSLV
jgi:hypothetical protein